MIGNRWMNIMMRPSPRSPCELCVTQEAAPRFGPTPGPEPRTLGCGLCGGGGGLGPGGVGFASAAAAVAPA